jgi:cell division protein FtsB
MGKFLRIAIFNRYVITLLAFTVWMIFLDTNSLKKQKLLDKKIDEINQMKVFYRAEIAKNNQAINEIQNNPAIIEKYAREKYLMKRDNEDVYVVIRE